MAQHLPVMKTVVLALVLLGYASAQDECNPRQFEYDSVVCVCDASGCDQPGIINFPEEGSFTVVTSSRDGLRFNVETFPVSSEVSSGAVVVTLNRQDTFQTMIGFGGAFTDATGLNLLTLPSEAQDLVLRAYFAPEGIGYNLCRIPIAGSDCSTRPYSYDDVEGDVDLEHWSLTDEDYNYKIPLILKAKELSQQEIKLFGSPWSPPSWMKTNGMFNGSGTLLTEMWQPWSNYIVKFVEAYEAEGAELWGLTPQNEPLSGFQDWGWNTCGWTAEDMRDWLKTTLGPTLEAAGMRRLKMMVDDFNRDTLPDYVQPMLEDPECAQYIDGTAVHWYSDRYVGPDVLDQTQALDPDKFLLYTEACQGYDVEGSLSVMLGSWARAEEYAHFVTQAVNHHSTGWVDWNMALDTLGGPNWANNFLDAPIIVNAEAGEFYKQPMFYALGHFSKFVLPGAERITSSTTQTTLESVAFNDPSGRGVVVLLNTGDGGIDVSVDDGSGSYLNYNMPAKSIQTILY
ncbi:putative glucosylceramidase 3 isoform X2 [Procambarus clarkii]|uniref:putative glucosylceramidase 3 isoform X2 n=1 Tax=Procambarus clarkii TaxID=6728 RepID=UPI001E675D55|nr:putative glucosylceramidase 3 isoform X2 [Procambarus clarkii]